MKLEMPLFKWSDLGMGGTMTGAQGRLITEPFCRRAGNGPQRIS